MIEVEGTAKNVNEAIEVAVSKALTELSLPREEITYELLERGKTGFLGLGGVWVKLRIFYEVGMTRKTEEFLNGLFELMNVKADVVAAEGEDGRVDVKLSGPDMGLLIGRRGETLDALQYITSLAANKGNEKFVRVTIDSENYREKREESLENLANRIADKVIKNQRSMTLEPMSPQERRIIHSCLQSKEGVTTFSTGQDPNRKVVIAPASAGEANGNNKHRQYRGHRGGARRHYNNNRGKGKPAETASAPAEE